MSYETELECYRIQKKILTNALKDILILANRDIHAEALDVQFLNPELVKQVCWDALKKVGQV